MQVKRIVLLGAGKVATHLGQAIKNQQLFVSFVWSRTASSAQKLGTLLECPATSNMVDIPDADLYIILVNDDAIELVAKKLSLYIRASRLVVHTSGALASTILKPYFKHYGVFYPLQSFSAGVPLLFSSIPLCIYAKSMANEKTLLHLANQLSLEVQIVTDEQRTYLHLAAVFTNNFTNYLQHISQSILKEQQLSPALLRPLLDETIKKLAIMPPREAQTGPAIRGDKKTLKKHLSLMKGKNGWQDIYEMLSEGIAKMVK